MHSNPVSETYPLSQVEVPYLSAETSKNETKRHQYAATERNDAGSKSSQHWIEGGHEIEACQRRRANPHEFNSGRFAF
jgi:hypothetical protein